MKTKNRRTYPRFRFMAMSKMIGIIAFGFVFMITVYSMKEMHNTGNYDALPQLIISAFGFASIYAGFYLTMVKAEHIEEEKTDNVYIKEGDYTPTVKIHRMDLKKDWYDWFAHELFVEGYYVEFFVPENTVTSEYKIDLR